jgi:hypothetical protein
MLVIRADSVEARFLVQNEVKGVLRDQHGKASLNAGGVKYYAIVVSGRVSVLRIAKFSIVSLSA